MWPSLNDANCQGTIFQATFILTTFVHIKNISAVTLKVSSWDHLEQIPTVIFHGDICPYQEYLSCYWQNFQQTFWALFLAALIFWTIILFHPHFLDRTIFQTKTFWHQHFDLTFFLPVIFWDKHFRLIQFFLPKIFGSKNTDGLKKMRINFFWTDKILFNLNLNATTKQ